MNAIVKSYSDQQVILNPPIKELSIMNRCVYPQDCTTIGFGIAVII